MFFSAIVDCHFREKYVLKELVGMGKPKFYCHSKNYLIIFNKEDQFSVFATLKGIRSLSEVSTK